MPQTMTVSWETLTAMLAGGRNNGFAAYPEEGWTLTFSVADDAGAVARSTVACRAGVNRGEAALELPGEGPFTISAVVDGKPCSRSERVKGATIADSVHVRIYVEGCDQPPCL